MTDISSWQYDEFRQVGTDYNDLAQVEAYDSRHSQFRDIDGECQAILGALDLTPKSSLIEIGTGTGAFAIHAAHHCAKVYATDVSQLMLDYAARKARDANVVNISFQHAGFLTYNHQDQPVDAIVTCMAFHHIPDFWKGIALHRMNNMLKHGGQLYLKDVIFEDADVTTNISRWIDHMAERGGEKLRAGIAAHIREEYSTSDWIIEGLLTRAGFKIQDSQVHEGVVGTYQCVKDK